MQPTLDLSLASGAFWPTLALQHWMQLQQMQLQGVLAWQRSMADLQQDWFDRWSCQCAGAARIDD